MTAAKTYYVVSGDSPPFEVEITSDGEGFDVSVSRDGASWTFRVEPSEKPERSLVNDRPRQVEWRPDADGAGRLFLDGVPHELEVVGRARYRAEGLSPSRSSSEAMSEVKTPMPGMIIALHVSEGDRVEAGDPIAIIEAMKMENEIQSPTTGRVEDVSVSVGTALEQGSPICRIVPDAE